MRAYMESGFYVIYLLFIIALGVFLMAAKKKQQSLFLFGLACITLGFGDAFHLVPRAIGLFTKTLDEPSANLAMWLGIGKLITSITMTIFYLILYFFIYKRFNLKRNLIIDICVYTLVLARFILCVFPQNGWSTNSGSLLWGILRNIPFTLLGILIIVLCFIYLRKERPYRLLWLAIIFSFAFYIPVVILASKYSWVGMMMLPKTICYMLIASMGLVDYIKYQ